MGAVRTISGPALRQSLLKELAPAANAIGRAMGTEGRAALYAVGNSVRRATSGAEIARRICGDGSVGRLFRETLTEAETAFGDGTSRLGVMAYAAFSAGFKCVESGYSPQSILTGLEALGAEVDDAFVAETRPFEDYKPLLRATALPAGLDALLVEALECSGPEGLVEVEEESGSGNRIEAGEGFVIEMESLLDGELIAMDDVFLVVANDVISDFRALVPVIEGFATSNKALIIAARGLEGQARALLERNRQAKVLRIAALRPQDQGPRAAELLEDLAIATGAVLVSEHVGTSLDSLRPDMLGHAAGYRRNRTRAAFLTPAGHSQAIDDRVRYLETEVRRHRYLAFDREHAARRLARLRQRWTRLVLDPDRLSQGEDSAPRIRRLIATLASARAGGVIEGGGMALDRIAARLEGNPASSQFAARAVIAACLRAPLGHLRRNASSAPHASWRPSSADGMADPAMLSRGILQMALSLAGCLISLEGAILRG